MEEKYNQATAAPNRKQPNVRKHSLALSHCLWNSPILTVKRDVQDIVCLDEVDVLVKQFDARLVVKYGASCLLLGTKALTSLLDHLLQSGLVFWAKIHVALLLWLVHATVHTDRYLNKNNGTLATILNKKPSQFFSCKHSLRNDAIFVITLSLFKPFRSTLPHLRTAFYHPFKESSAKEPLSTNTRVPYLYELAKLRQREGLEDLL